MRKLFPFLLCFALFPLLRGETVVFLGARGDSELCAAAFRDLPLPEKIRFRYLCSGTDPETEILKSLREADLLILNARSRELRRLAEEKVDHTKTRLYALSAHLLKKGTPALEPPEVALYRKYRRPENFRNLLLRIVALELDPSVKAAPPVTLPEVGAAHPAAGTRVFSSLREYRKWARETGRFSPGAPLIAFAVHAASINEREMALFRCLTDECEKAGLNTVIVFGDEVKLIRDLLLDPRGRSRVEAVLALSFKFKSGLGKELGKALEDLDVPVFNALRLYRQNTEEWRSSPRGMNDFSVAFGFIAPEISGLIEPSLLFGSRTVAGPGGRKIQIQEPLPAQIRNTAARLKKWTELRRKKNSEKRIALFIYNGAGGKQNIGASYLNVPRSLTTLLPALHRRGYETGGLEKLDEKALTAALLKSARNAGPWAPGEEAALAAAPETVKLPLAKYLDWFRELPERFRESVTKEWGPPEKSKGMFLNGQFIIPMLKRGNAVILPEPMRGWLGDPHKLVHSATLAPPHQYLAVYLWLRHEFRADAMIHLGRHGSSEWLPGKQLGLDCADAPMIVRGDIPEIYPYISDGIGEGIVAKRRAQAVTVAHLPPFLQTGPREKFLAELEERIGACLTADPAVKEARMNALRGFALDSGLGERLDLKGPGWFRRLEHYTEMRKGPAPFGLHVFGVSPRPEEIRAMLARLPEKERRAAERHLSAAGEDELRALLRALDGRYIPPGPSGDPLRNPRMLPAGRNFYSFDPAKVPTPEAMKTGEKLAAELLKNEKLRLGRLPRSAALVLWAGESVRTDGSNEALALALMGMTLTYDGAGKVTGVVPVPGRVLGRPRIDVLITASGAYRDQFASLLRLLERARRQAARLRDAENFIQAGRPGIFFPAPGTYGTRVNRLAGASGIWEKDDELAAIYLRNMKWTLDEKGRFKAAPEALAAGVKEVETLLHSRSSNVYGVTDIDDMYQYLGGLSLAVRKSSGKAPGAYIADQRDPAKTGLAGLKSFIAAELDTRLYNREWLKSAMRENYAGAKLMARMTDNIWGWQSVAPEAVSAADWEKLYQICVQDRYKLALKAFFEENNEWAFQSMTGRMLEAVRKNFWQAPEAVKRELAASYARSVVTHGMACCDHTCNNPLLNQMVVNIISLPGVLAPEMVMKFQAAVEKAGGKKLGEQVSERRELLSSLAPAPGPKKPLPPAPPQRSDARERRPEEARNKAETLPVKGFRMKPEESRAEKTSLTSSGLQWTVLIGVFLLMGIFALGWLGKEK